MSFGQLNVAIQIYNICKGRLGSRGGKGLYNMYHTVIPYFQQYLSFSTCVIQQFKLKLSATFTLLNIFKVAASNFDEHLSFLSCII